MCTCQVSCRLCCSLNAEDRQLVWTWLYADMDGFKLLEHVGLELDLPVISEALTLCQLCLDYDAVLHAACCLPVWHICCHTCLTSRPLLLQ